MAIAIQFYNNVAAESGPESRHNEIIYPIVALPGLTISQYICRVSPGYLPGANFPGNSWFRILIFRHGHCLSAMAEHGCLHADRFVVGLGRSQTDECYGIRHSVTLWSPQFATSLGHQKAGRHGSGSVSQYSCNQWPLSGQAQPKQEAQAPCHAVPDHNLPVSGLPLHERVIWSSRERAIRFLHGCPSSQRPLGLADWLVWPLTRSSRCWGCIFPMLIYLSGVSVAHWD